MKKNIVIGVALGVVLALTGCGTTTTPEMESHPIQSQGNGVFVKVVTLPDDTTVDCVILRTKAVTCDWERRS